MLEKVCWCAPYGLRPKARAPTCPPPLLATLLTSSINFVSLNWSRITDTLAINWQNFASSSTSAQVCFYNTALNFVQVCLKKFAGGCGRIPCILSSYASEEEQIMRFFFFAFKNNNNILPGVIKFYFQILLLHL